MGYSLSTNINIMTRESFNSLMLSMRSWFVLKYGWLWQIITDESWLWNLAWDFNRYMLSVAPLQWELKGRKNAVSGWESEAGSPITQQSFFSIPGELAPKLCLEVLRLYHGWVVPSWVCSKWHREGGKENLQFQVAVESNYYNMTADIKPITFHSISFVLVAVPFY